MNNDIFNDACERSVGFRKIGLIESNGSLLIVCLAHLVELDVLEIRLTLKINRISAWIQQNYVSCEELAMPVI